MFGGVFPGTGGLSGNLAIKVQSSEFIDSEEIVGYTFLGIILHKRAVPKKSSNNVDMDTLTPSLAGE